MWFKKVQVQQTKLCYFVVFLLLSNKMLFEPIKIQHFNGNCHEIHHCPDYWTIVLEEAASLIQNFLPWSFAVLTFSSRNVES